MTRASGRKHDELRPFVVIKDYLPNSAGSCVIKMGNTHVLCSATVEEHVPPFLRGKGSGWLTAEYAMLPTSTHQRIKRETSKTAGRNQEIQRLIGRSLRAALDLERLGERQIIVDCDVLSADGGTRCASITGAFIAVKSAINSLLERGVIHNNPIISQVAAVSCCIYKGEVLVDPDYAEDSEAEVDANFILNGSMNIIEVQASSERQAMSKKQLYSMLDMAESVIPKLFAVQNL